ncbi:hypothetical protein [Halorubrum vacuolatum]|uniref:hypothetical protein n=1 Tax=Halorubrum vacuolatum TaxID=63740 RepID=UPI00117B0B53|nr:hypothetical protein [Halorubrum vacuolatum]
MPKETAITEEISYSTSYCDVCGEEVAMDDVPEDVIEPQGYAVLLGEGTVSREFADAGNWDQEIQFELEESETRLPDVSAYLVCEDCVEVVHGISPESPPYTGKLPPELTSKLRQKEGSTEIPSWLIYLVVIAVFLFILFIIF